MADSSEEEIENQPAPKKAKRAEENAVQPPSNDAEPPPTIAGPSSAMNNFSTEARPLKANTSSTAPTPPVATGSPAAGGASTTEESIASDTKAEKFEFHFDISSPNEGTSAAAEKAAAVATLTLCRLRSAPQSSRWYQKFRRKHHYPAMDCHRHSPKTPPSSHACRAAVRNICKCWINANV